MSGARATAMTLEGKRALVTGAAQGIGRAIADALRDAGASVAMLDKAGIADAPADVLALKADVLSEADVLSAMANVQKEFGGLDIVVNNAGILLERGLLDCTIDDFDRVIGVNLRGPFLVGREAIGMMVDQGAGGRVLNISSELAYLGREDFSLYCASKSGVLGLTRSWAREFAPKILVNAVAPGPTDTAMLDINSMSPEWREKETAIPLGRIGTPDEIAKVVTFLAGPDASFITGQCYQVNGGAVMP
ncbi:MAG: SDR family NAD(P)-dependent oxidoreductase [Geminicoccaceae bacterium]